MNIFLSLAFIVTIYCQYKIFEMNEVKIIKLQQNLIHQEALKFNFMQSLSLNLFEDKEMTKAIVIDYKFSRNLTFCSVEEDLKKRTVLNFYKNREFVELNYLGKIMREGKYFVNNENLILQNYRLFERYPDIQKINIFDYDEDGLPLSLDRYPFRKKICFNPSL